MWRELRAIAASYSVVLVLVGGVFAYGVLYNYMYAPNVVREVPLVVVDHSQSALSRRYASLLDATPEVAVAYHAADMPEAKRLLAAGEAYGILYLPADFERSVFEGRSATLPLYAVTDAFLYYESVERANMLVLEALDAEYRTALAPYLSPQGLVAAATQSPVEVVGTALYNPIEGYGVYLIPSVLMIIIFQTLMMLVAMRAGSDRQHGALTPYVRMRGGRTSVALSLVCGKSFAYALLYAIFAFFLVGFLPLIFNIPHGAPWGSLVALLVPYILGTAFLGMALSRWYTDAEAPILLIAFFSIGLIFLSGVSYPFELMPWYWQAAHYIVPAAPAVMAYVQLGSMDATLHDVWPQLLALWVQMAVYFMLAVLCYRGKLKGAPSHL